MFGNHHIRLFSEENITRIFYWDVFFIIGVLFFSEVEILLALQNDYKNSSSSQIFYTIRSLMSENSYVFLAVKIH